MSIYQAHSCIERLATQKGLTIIKIEIFLNMLSASKLIDKKTVSPRYDCFLHFLPKEKTLEQIVFFYRCEAR